MSIVKGTRNVQKWTEEPCLQCTKCTVSFRDTEEGALEAANHAKTHIVANTKEGFLYITQGMLLEQKNKNWGQKFYHQGFNYRIDWVGDGWYKLIGRDDRDRSYVYFDHIDSLIDAEKTKITDAAAELKWLKAQKKRLEDGF